MVAFVRCSECRRHVREDETACPFCGFAGSLSSAPRGGAVAGMGRAALFAFGVAATACGSPPVVAPYGIAPDDAGPVDGGDDAGPPEADASTDAGTDAGRTSDAGPESDAGIDAGNIVPPYGAPALIELV